MVSAVFIRRDGNVDGGEGGDSEKYSVVGFSLPPRITRAQSVKNKKNVLVRVNTCLNREDLLCPRVTRKKNA